MQRFLVTINTEQYIELKILYKKIIIFFRNKNFLDIIIFI